MKYNWYVLKVRSQREAKVASAIQAMDEDFGEGKDIEEVFCASSKNGSSESSSGKQRADRSISGYLFVKMDMQSVQLNKLLNISDVLRVLSDSQGPTITPQVEIDRMKATVSSVEAETDTSISIEVGDMVDITDGPMDNLYGEVMSIDHKKQMVKVKLDILGRPLPVDVGLSKIKKRVE